MIQTAIAKGHFCAPLTQFNKQILLCILKAVLKKTIIMSEIGSRRHQAFYFWDLIHCHLKNWFSLYKRRILELDPFFQKNSKNFQMITMLIQSLKVIDFVGHWALLVLFQNLLMALIQNHNGFLEPCFYLMIILEWISKYFVCQINA